MKLYERKDHRYYKGLIPLKLKYWDFIFCFGSNSTGHHGSVTAELAVKHFESEIGVASGRQGQSYRIVTIALKKGFTDPKTGTGYDEHSLTPTQMKVSFKDLYGYSSSHPGLMFVVAYTVHARSNPRLHPAHNACGYNSTQLVNFFGSCDICGVPSNVVFEDQFDGMVYRHCMQPVRRHLLHGLPGHAFSWSH